MRSHTGPVHGNSVQPKSDLSYVMDGVDAHGARRVDCLDGRVESCDATHDKVVKGW